MIEDENPMFDGGASPDVTEQDVREAMMLYAKKYDGADTKMPNTLIDGADILKRTFGPTIVACALSRKIRHRSRRLMTPFMMRSTTTLITGRSCNEPFRSLSRSLVSQQHCRELDLCGPVGDGVDGAGAKTFDLRGGRNCRA
jgi:hypothetical protein